MIIFTSAVKRFHDTWNLDVNASRWAFCVRRDPELMPVSLGFFEQRHNGMTAKWSDGGAYFGFWINSGWRSRGWGYRIYEHDDRNEHFGVGRGQFAWGNVHAMPGWAVKAIRVVFDRLDEMLARLQRLTGQGDSR